MVLTHCTRKRFNLSFNLMDESANLSAKTRARALEPITKHGYMDGASDGRNASFQSSFNTGYEQGFGYGLDLGFNEALKQLKHESIEYSLQDPRRINCQMCLTSTGEQENVVNLYNMQKEKNDSYFISVQSDK